MINLNFSYADNPERFQVAIFCQNSSNFWCRALVGDHMILEGRKAGSSDHC